MVATSYAPSIVKKWFDCSVHDKKKVVLYQIKLWLVKLKRAICKTSDATFEVSEPNCTFTRCF